MIIYLAIFSSGRKYYGISSENLFYRKAKHRRAADNDSPNAFHEMFRRSINDELEYRIIKETDHPDEIRHTLIGKYVIEFNTIYNGIEDPFAMEQVLFLDELSHYFVDIPKRRGWTQKSKEKMVQKLKLWFFSHPVEHSIIKQKISNTKRQMYNENRLYMPQDMGVEAARKVNTGTKWFNDGVSNYRLKPVEGWNRGLHLGLIKYDESRIIKPTRRND